MIGVVLCGGQSTRMGSDKGLLQYDGASWAQIAFKKLTALSFPAVISVNAKQVADYSKIFNLTDLLADNESLEIKGPLCGILSAHLEYAAEDLIVLACDMPLMEIEILKECISQSQKHPDSEAVVFTSEEGPEPLCGIYTSKGLGRIYNFYKKGQLPKHSMKYVLDHILTFYIHLTDDKKKYFTNYNTQSELNRS